MYNRESIIIDQWKVGATSRFIDIILFAVFTAICAQLAIRLPFTPVPVTVQTLFVVLAGMMLGPRDGFYAMSWYLIMGLCGAPVFAGFAFGPAVLFGPTGGYLLAFPLAALLSGYVFHSLGRKNWSAFLGAVTGSVAILAGGAVYMGIIFKFSFAETLTLAVAPFVFGEMIKAFIASGIVVAKK